MVHSFFRIVSRKENHFLNTQTEVLGIRVAYFFMQFYDDIFTVSPIYCHCKIAEMVGWRSVFMCVYCIPIQQRVSPPELLISVLLPVNLQFVDIKTRSCTYIRKQTHMSFKLKSRTHLKPGPHCATKYVNYRLHSLGFLGCFSFTTILVGETFANLENFIPRKIKNV